MAEKKDEDKLRLIISGGKEMFEDIMNEEMKEDVLVEMIRESFGRELVKKDRKISDEEDALEIVVTIKTKKK